MGRPPRFKFDLPPSSDPGYPAAYYRASRLKAIELLGGECVRCGFADVRILQFDHVKGDGHKDRQRTPGGGSRGDTDRAWRAILKGEREKYQLLCPNCNCIKRDEEQEHLNYRG